MLLDLWRAKRTELSRRSTSKQIVHTWDNQSGINKAWLGGRGRSAAAQSLKKDKLQMAVDDLRAGRRSRR